METAAEPGRVFFLAFASINHYTFLIWLVLQTDRADS